MLRLGQCVLKPCSPPAHSHYLERLDKKGKIRTSQNFPNRFRAFILEDHVIYQSEEYRATLSSELFYIPSPLQSHCLNKTKGASQSHKELEGEYSFIIHGPIICTVSMSNICDAWLEQGTIKQLFVNI
jgi:hypothetical protein